MQMQSGFPVYEADMTGTTTSNPANMYGPRDGWTYATNGAKSLAPNHGYLSYAKSSTPSPESKIQLASDRLQGHLAPTHSKPTHMKSAGTS